MPVREPFPRVLIFDDAAEVARAVAERFVAVAQAASASSGRFSVALAGGTTPKRVYELLASEELRSRVDWQKAHIFFGDERCVPPDHAESNYRMASEALLSHLDTPAQNIHRMRGEGDALANARLYEDEMRAYFDGAAWPRLDLVLLGLGEDGHTASLFPATAALGEQQSWVAANWVEQLKAFRLTLTVPAINHAAHIVFMVVGAGKAERLAAVLQEEPEERRLPSQLIRPLDGSLEWYVDRAASARL
ncbi:MAG TPA: 6-phosphogluconolactonase [Pyrinomonadaceae bacterium]|jgi:6-phosphogluconolactonase